MEGLLCNRSPWIKSSNATTPSRGNSTHKRAAPSNSGPETRIIARRAVVRMPDSPTDCPEPENPASTYDECGRGWTVVRDLMAGILSVPIILPACEQNHYSCHSKQIGCTSGEAHGKMP